MTIDPIFIPAFERYESKPLSSRIYSDAWDFAFAAFTGIFFRIQGIVLRFLFSVFPKKRLEMLNLQFKKTEGCVEITKKKIQEGYFTTEENKKLFPSEKRMLDLLDRAKKIARKSGISQKISLFTSKNLKFHHSSFTNGSKFALTSIPIFIHLSDLHASDQVLDFTLGHEIGHICHNDILKDAFYSLAILVLEIACAILFTPFAIPLIEGGAFVGDTFIRLDSEIDADLHAMKLFQSNQGAIASHKLLFQLVDKDHEFHEHTLKRILFAYEAIYK